MGSSINLFISRNINRVINLGFMDFTIPTPWFQSLNPFIILLATPVVTYTWIKLGRKKIHLSSIIKFAFGFLLVTLGFTMIFLGAQLAAISGKTSMIWVVIGLMLIGLAELFFDPVAIAFVSRIAPKGSLSVMIGVYYLFTGAIANYIAAQIAKLTAIHLPKKATLMQHAAGYESIYFKITLICLALLLCMIMFRVIFRKLSLK